MEENSWIDDVIKEHQKRKRLTYISLFNRVKSSHKKQKRT
jgi:hypothetical protein